MYCKTFFFFFVCGRAGSTNTWKTEGGYMGWGGNCTLEPSHKRPRRLPLQRWNGKVCQSGSTFVSYSLLSASSLKRDLVFLLTRYKKIWWPFFHFMSFLPTDTLKSGARWIIARASHTPNVTLAASYTNMTWATRSKFSWWWERIHLHG